MKIKRKTLKIITILVEVILALLIFTGYYKKYLSVVIICIVVLVIINAIKDYFVDDDNQIEQEDNSPEEPTSPLYIKRDLMTESEFKFYNKLAPLNDKYNVVPQLNLATIIKKTRDNKYISELFRNIDYAVFSKDYKDLLILIELNDETHESNSSRKRRDIKVKDICKQANIKLITFYTKYSNEKEYVISRILKEIDDSTSINSELNNKDELK